MTGPSWASLTSLQTHWGGEKGGSVKVWYSERASAPWRYVQARAHGGGLQVIAKKSLEGNGAEVLGLLVNKLEPKTLADTMQKLQMRLETKGLPLAGGLPFDPILRTIRCAWLSYSGKQLGQAWSPLAPHLCMPLDAMHACSERLQWTGGTSILSAAVRIYRGALHHPEPACCRLDELRAAVGARLLYGQKDSLDAEVTAVRCCG